MTLSIDLSAAQAARLRAEAGRLGLTAEKLRMVLDAIASREGRVSSRGWPS